MAQTTPDIRLSTSFLRNLKTRRLLREVGPAGVLCLVNLWFYAAENHTDGVLPMTIEDAIDVADADRFGVDASIMMLALMDGGWVTQDDNGNVLLHQWEEHQSWVVGAEERSQRARDNAHKGWAKRRKPRRKRSRPPDASGIDAGMAASSGQHASAKQAAMLLSSPLPSPKTPLPPGKRGDRLLRRLNSGGAPPDGHATWDAFFGAEALSRNCSAEEAKRFWTEEREATA